MIKHDNDRYDNYNCYNNNSNNNNANDINNSNKIISSNNYNLCFTEVCWNSPL